jgi:hypothetical protein
MKRVFIWMALLLPMTLPAQQKQGPALPVRVANVTLTDLDKNPVQFADYGKKHMMIFYVDPDAHRQNAQFQADIEVDKSLHSPNIQAYAVLNLKDTALPNGIVRSMAEKRTKGKPSINLADSGRILRDAWSLGDCNNKFCLLFVTKSGELIYFRAGEFTEQDKKDFYDTVAKYK